jgi:hypothetical protein
LFSGQEPGDRDAGAVHSPSGGGEGILSLWCWDRRVPAGRDAILLADLVLDLEVQAAMGVAGTRHELAYTRRAGHGPLGTGQVADEVGGDQLVDQLESSVIEDCLDEQLDLEPVELAHVVHLRHRAGRAGTAVREGPRRSPPMFCLAVPPTWG